MNQRKIRELEQDLSADQRQTQQAQKVGSNSATPASNSATVQAGGAAPATQLPASTEPPRDPVADAERALAFKARFASNLIAQEDHTPRSSSIGRADSADAIVRSAPDNDAISTHSTGLPSQPAATGNKRAPEVSVNSAHGQPYVLFEGTTIDTALVNRLDGEFAGPVKVMVTNPVYSRDRQHVLIPEGTFILGDVQKVSSFGQKRLAVTFHRLLMPDGYSVDLD
jgi:type IV secretion system protein VirB10